MVNARLCEKARQAFFVGSLRHFDFQDCENRMQAGDESSSNLRTLEGKHLTLCFSIFYYVNISTKSKTDREFSPISFGEIGF